MSEGFLSRWSRRKAEVARTAAPEAPAPPAPADAPVPEAEPAAPDDGLTPEEIAALPRPEDLTPDMDLGAFMRRGVPAALRNAALRRMWALDPAIRDYVDPARDYAYDWNVPGGVPGGGELAPGPDAEALVRRLLDGEAPVEPAPPARPAEAPSEPDPVGSGSEPLPPAPPGCGKHAALDQLPSPVAGTKPVAGFPHEPENVVPARPSRRRGGAVPV